MNLFKKSMVLAVGLSAILGVAHAERVRGSFKGEKGYYYVNDSKTDHAEQGGFVADTASVESGAYIGPTARVLGNATVEGSARIYGRAVVTGEARVRGNARVYGAALVDGNATVEGQAEVSGFAHVTDTATVTEEARVMDEALVGGTATIKGKAMVRGGSEVRDGDVAAGVKKDPPSEAHAKDIAEAKANDALLVALLAVEPWTTYNTQGKRGTVNVGPWALIVKCEDGIHRVDLDGLEIYYHAGEYKNQMAFMVPGFGFASSFVPDRENQPIRDAEKLVGLKK